jgi:hypothetical protein
MKTQYLSVHIYGTGGLWGLWLLKREWDLVESPSRFRLLITHDLFGKPVPTFPDHALGQSRKFFKNIPA